MADKAARVEDCLFESVSDAEAGILSLKVNDLAIAELAKLRERGESTFALFIPEKVLNKLVVQMAFAVQRRKVTDRLWTPGSL